MTWSVKARGAPDIAAEEIAREIRASHGEAPDGWEASVHMMVAGGVGATVLRLGQLLVSRDLRAQEDARIAIIEAWRKRVEAAREKWLALPREKQGDGFVAEPEPDLPRIDPKHITAECLGSSEIDGVTSYTVHVQLLD